MDIFKLFFNHDLPIRHETESTEKRVEDFMSPTPTYSKFYITGTRLDKNEFGIDVLSKSPSLLSAMDDIFAEKWIHTVGADGQQFSNILANISTGQPMLLTDDEETSIDIGKFTVGEESNIGHFIKDLEKPLLDGSIVAYKEQAKNGYDLHIFSKENIYKPFFDAFKELVDNSFRFFSINSKRMRSERHFYFETWTLDRPPHGAEEVFAETEF